MKWPGDLMEKLARQFTRDFSLYVCQWLQYGLKHHFKSAIGTGYEDYMIVGNGKNITTYFIERNLDEIRQAVLNKIKTRQGWHHKLTIKFRKDVGKSRKIISKLRKDGKFTSNTVDVLKKRHILLFPMLRLSILIPTVLSESIKSEFGKMGEGIISEAYANRKFSDGVFEEIDYLLRRFAANKIRELGYDERLAKVLTEEELERLANGRKIDFKDLKKRSNGYVVCRGKIHYSKDYNSIFKKNSYSYVEEKIDSNEIKGVTAYDGGKVRGQVRLLFALEDLHTFKKNEILVSPMTVPDFLPAMKIAKAIITDEGGITCHAAIVAREIKIPCVIGTKNASKILKDGQIVEVDSHFGKIRKLPTRTPSA